VSEQLRESGGRRPEAAQAGLAASAADAEAERKTLALPAVMSPVQFPGRLLPKPTPVNLRRFARLRWCGGRST